MDFFSEQERARRRGGRLVALFIAAVIGIVLSIYFICMVALTHQSPGGIIWWDSQIFLLVAGGSLTVIALGSLGRILSLGSGGASVAEMLGGQLISPDTRDADERRVLNVVEEMALASGMAVPPVYILHEEGINAFAAGVRKENAVIGVTRGAIAQLSRDELQGVIAHEFSHILHGDMRLNIRLMGLLYGILMISIIGSVMMRVYYFAGSGRRRSSEKNDGAAVIMAIAAAGLAMYILGYIGVFFGNLIKAAVSRQREFLADASAVQYTRNPDGIGGALKHIAGFHTKISHAGANEASHLFFGPISSFSNFLATHPPIEERIRRLDPSFTGAATSSTSRRPATNSSGLSSGFAAPVVGEKTNKRQRVLDSVGDPGMEHLAHSRQLLAGLGESLCEEFRHPYSARAVIYGLLLDGDPAVAALQGEIIRKQADPQVQLETQRLQAQVRALAQNIRLEVVGLCLPALSQLSQEQTLHFLQVIEQLILADKKMTVFEYTLRHILRLTLEPGFSMSVKGKARSHDIHTLLSMVAIIGSPNDLKTARDAYCSAIQELAMPADAFSQDSSWADLDGALLRLARLKPLKRREILGAVLTAVSHDGKIEEDEVEVCRAIASSLDCPIPPWVSAAS